MGNPRAAVVTALEAAVPSDVRVMGYARDIDTAGKVGTVMVRVEEVNPSAQPQAMREYKFALILVVPRTTTGDDDLDALLEDVLYALETRNDGIVWTAARRATFEEKFPAYQVDITVHFATSKE